jgi:hypothetical protein
MRSLTLALSLALTFTPLGSGRADEPDLELSRGPVPTVRTGQKSSVSLTLLPRSGARLYTDGPLIVRVEGNGVKLPRTLYLREDAVDPRAEAPRFEIQFSPERAEWKLAARVTAWICRGSRCRPVELEALYGTSL